MRIKKMHKQAVVAEDKARTLRNRILVVGFYKQNFDLELNSSLIEKMDLLHLEMSYRMMRLDQLMEKAATTIAACYKALKVRRFAKRIKLDMKKSIIII